MCVCKWSWADCVFDVAMTGEGCNRCNNLLEAIRSYLVEIFARVFEYDPMEGGLGDNILEWWKR